MTDDIVTRLREEVAKAEVDGVLPHWELAKCMWEAADEIERLRATIGGWSQDISNLEDEVEKLRGDLEDCEKDFEVLSSIFNEVRTERDQLIRGATEK